MALDFIGQMITDLEGIKNVEPSIFNKERGLPEDLADSRGVYVIRQVGGDPVATYAAYVEHLETKGAKKYPPVNKKPNQVLYVGKETTRLKKRMNDHLVKASYSTSALRLYEWLEEDYQVEVYIFYEMSGTLIKAIESSLAKELQPAFGQHGKI